MHWGAAVGLDASGKIAFAIGDPALPIFPRSAWKPVQAVAMVRCGLSLSGERLAVACASHSGSARQLDAVRGILDAAGLPESALQNTEGSSFHPTYLDPPLEPRAAAAPLTMGCSGKHAAMLLTSVLQGWPTADYLDPGHPVQRRIAATSRELGGDSVALAGRDGCGAPAFVCQLVALAQAFRSIAIGARGSAESAVCDAMLENPEIAAGIGRVATDFMRAMPGVLVKDGAEGVIAACTPEGCAVAIKVADGNPRAWRPVLAAGLRRIGYAVPDGPYARELLLGGDQPVGEMRVAECLAS